MLTIKTQKKYQAEKKVENQKLKPERSDRQKVATRPDSTAIQSKSVIGVSVPGA